MSPKEGVGTLLDVPLAGLPWGFVKFRMAGSIFLDGAKRCLILSHV